MYVAPTSQDESGMTQDMHGRADSPQHDVCPQHSWPQQLCAASKATMHMRACTTCMYLSLSAPADHALPPCWTPFLPVLQQSPGHCRWTAAQQEASTWMTPPSCFLSLCWKLTGQPTSQIAVQSSMQTAVVPAQQLPASITGS